MGQLFILLQSGSITNVTSHDEETAISQNFLKLTRKTEQTNKSKMAWANFNRQQWLTAITFVVVNFCNAMCVSMQVNMQN